MCGRATLTVSPADLRETFDLIDVPDMPPRFNIAPSQPLPVIRTPGHLELLTWGPKFINARLEAATTKPANRCLVVLDGFYEWRDGDRQPFYFHRVDRKPFAVGGVLRSATDACAIVTCPAGEGMIDIHNRMPVVLGSANERAAWLAGDKTEGSLVGMKRWSVTRFVNTPKNDDVRCIEPGV